MQAQHKRPLRVALALCATLGPFIGIGAGHLELWSCYAVGSLGLFFLARWPKQTPSVSRYGLPLLMLLPVAAAQISSFGSALRFGLAIFALGLWAGLGVRLPKGVPASAAQPSAMDHLAMVGLFLLWASLGFMGGALCKLVWTSSAITSKGLMISGVYTVVFHHARFYLTAPGRSHEPPSPAAA